MEAALKREQYQSVSEGKEIPSEYFTLSKHRLVLLVVVNEANRQLIQKKHICIHKKLLFSAVCGLERCRTLIFPR